MDKSILLTLGSFIFFTALVAAITWWKSRGGEMKSDDGFFLAGRSLTFPFIAMSLLRGFGAIYGMTFL